MSSKIILTCRRVIRRSSRFYCSASQDSQKESNVESKKEKLPFINNVLIGKFDRKLLIYPEILNNKKLKSLESTYLALESGQEKVDLQKIGALTLPDSEFAMDEERAITLSESSKLAESIDSPSLALILDISQNIIPRIIEMYGSKEQIEKYVKKLKRGQLLAAYAISEEKTGSDLPSLECTAVKCEDVWKLSGKKKWVANGVKADLLLVLAKSLLELDAPSRNELSAFIVERGAAYKIDDEINVGKDLGICNLTFKDAEATLLGQFNEGYQVGREFLASYKHYLAGCSSRLLKKFISSAVHYVKDRHQRMGPLHEKEMILHRLGSASSVAYALDSLIYLMAGLCDGFEVNTDTEAVLMHLFLADAVIPAMDQCLSIMGSTGIDPKNNLYSIRHELWTVLQAVFSLDVNRQFAAINALDYAGKELSEDIRKLRQSFKYPAYILRKIWNDGKLRRDNPKLTLLLYEELHPSLKLFAEDLEYLVLKCCYAVENMFSMHASEIINRQDDLQRLVTVMIDILAITACLGRASRSYCTGIKFADDELTACAAFCRSASLRSRQLLQDILDGPFTNNDMNNIELGQKIVSRVGYFLEHPLVRNIE